MAVISAASNPNAGLLIEFLISLASTGGLTGLLVAFAKLRPEKTSAAIAQAQGANEALVETLEAVERERDYWMKKYEACHARSAELYAELMTRPRGGPS